MTQIQALPLIDTVLVMALPAGVRAGRRLRFSYEEVVETFRDIFGHPHELVVRRGWGSALRHKEANSLCGIAQTEHERHRGTPDEVFRGERLSSGKLCHDVGK